MNVIRSSHSYNTAGSGAHLDLHLTFIYVLFSRACWLHESSACQLYKYCPDVNCAHCVFVCLYKQAQCAVYKISVILRDAC